MSKATITPTDFDSVFGTSFFNDTITTTFRKLTNVLGEPGYEDNTGEDKVNFEWACKYIAPGIEILFTVYDYKEYRAIKTDELIEWHIGGKNMLQTRVVLNELISKL